VSFLVNEGVSLYVVQALLGHANARTTQRYDTEKSVESKRLLMACSMCPAVAEC
jgi:site-specific recombinase XerD